MAHAAQLFPEGEEAQADSGTRSFSWERRGPSDGVLGRTRLVYTGDPWRSALYKTWATTTMNIRL